MNPEIYSKIVAKMPELAIKCKIGGTTYRPRHTSWGWEWFAEWQSPQVGLVISTYPMRDGEFEQAVESHWLRKLEDDTALAFADGECAIVRMTNPHSNTLTKFHPTPLAALTEHFSKEIA